MSGPPARPPFSFTLIAGGRSNLTYRVDDAAGHVVRPAPPTAQPRPSHGPRHGPRAPGHHRPRADGGPGARDLRTVRRPRGQRATLLRDGVRRRPHRPGRRTRRERARRLVTTGGPASPSPTRWPPCTPWTSTPSGLGDFANRDGYIERQLRRWYEQFRNSQVAGLDTASVVGAVHDRLAAPGPAPGGDVDRARRLPPRQHRARRLTGRCTPCSTGRSAPSATRSPTSGS